VTQHTASSIFTLTTWKYALFCASDQILGILNTTVELDVVLGSLVAVVSGLAMHVELAV